MLTCFLLPTRFEWVTVSSYIYFNVLETSTFMKRRLVCNCVRWRASVSDKRDNDRSSSRDTICCVGIPLHFSTLIEESWGAAVCTRVNKLGDNKVLSICSGCPVSQISYDWLVVVPCGHQMGCLLVCSQKHWRLDPMPGYIDEDVRICIWYEYKLGRTVREAHENLTRVFGARSVSFPTVNKYFWKFRGGNENLEKHRRGACSCIDDEKLKRIMEQRPDVSVDDLARLFGVAKATVSYQMNKLARGGGSRVVGKKSKKVCKVCYCCISGLALQKICQQNTRTHLRECWRLQTLDGYRAHDHACHAAKLSRKIKNLKDVRSISVRRKWRSRLIVRQSWRQNQERSLLPGILYFLHILHCVDAWTVPRGKHE